MTPPEFLMFCQNNLTWV